MAELTYRSAVTRGIAQEMRRDDTVVLVGEDVAAAGGVFKATAGLVDEFGPRRVIDTPISEQAFLGAALGAAMTGMRPIVEIMYADFLGVCWDVVVNQIAKARYMSGGQLSCPMVIRVASGAGLRFGAQHSQSVENWAMSVPGLKVVAPSSPGDVVSLLAAAVRDDDPVLFFEHKALYPTKQDVPDGDLVGTLGEARVVREGDDVTVIALGAMVHRALAAAEIAAERGVSLGVVDLRSLVPLDTRTVLQEVRRTGRALIAEENPRLCGWGAEVASILAEEAFWDLDAPVTRVAGPHVPVPAAGNLEDLWIPSPETIAGRAVGLLREEGQ